MEQTLTSKAKRSSPAAICLFAIGDQLMVGGCRCLKENLDELRIERVCCYERVTG